MDLIKRALKLIGTAWLILGVVVILGVILQRSFQSAILDPRTKADVYKNKIWAVDYFRELSASYVTGWQAYTHWRRLPFQGKHININKAGLRQTWNSQTNRKDTGTRTLEIYMFGGSTMWGTGARDNHTIPSYVSKSLSEKTRLNVRVTNFGESGYVSMQEVIALSLALKKGNIPDLVIFYDGYNDIYSALQNKIAGSPQNEFKRKREFNITGHYNRLAKLYFQETAQMILEKLGLNIFKDRANVNDDIMTAEESNRLSDDVIQNYRENLMLVEGFAKLSNFDLLFYWQPTIFTKSKLSPDELQLRDSSSKSYQKFYFEVYDKMKKFESVYSGFNYYNLSNLFHDIDHSLYIDEVHIAEEGNEIVASRMAEDILKILKSK